MTCRFQRTTHSKLLAPRELLKFGLFLLYFSSCGFAQTAQNARSAVPADFTGYWVTIISPDWRERMIPPAKGDYATVPITAAAQKIGDVWDPAKDEAAGEQCKSYAAPALNSTPTRFHITWLDDNTLKIDSDYGMQVRLLHFGNWKTTGGEATWQGESKAVWERAGGRGSTFGNLKITTTNLRPGYVRKNGVPYSSDIRMTEYWDLFKDPSGTKES